MSVRLSSGFFRVFDYPRFGSPFQAHSKRATEGAVISVRMAQALHGFIPPEPSRMQSRLKFSGQLFKKNV